MEAYKINLINPIRKNGQREKNDSLEYRNTFPQISAEKSLSFVIHF